MNQLEKINENTQDAAPEKNETIVHEVISLLFEFEFEEFKEIFKTLQSFTESNITYKVIVAESRDTGFPILELTGNSNDVHEALEKLGYSKDMLSVDEAILDEKDLLDDEQEYTG